MSDTEDRHPEPLRREPRVEANLRVRTASIDPVFDPVRGSSYFQTSEDDAVVNLSRRGAQLRCSRPPEVGTRLLLQIETSDAPAPIEVIARTRWTRVEFDVDSAADGRGALAFAAVGIEVVGGSKKSLDRLDRAFAHFGDEASHSVATPQGVG
jgi:hypothetical protein